MNTACTGAMFGTGDYCKGVKYSELRTLLRIGENIMSAKGLAGEALSRASRIYVRTTIHFYHQSGGQPLSEHIQNEFIDRVIAKLALSSDLRCGCPPTSSQGARTAPDT